MSQRPATDSQIEVQASEWLVAMSDRAVSAERRKQFDTWFRADPEHARVYRAQQTAWGSISNMRHLLDDSDGLHAARSRAKPFALAAAVLLVFLGATLSAYRLQWFGPQSRFETATGQVRELTLADGTVVTLGGDSQIRVSLDKTDRRVVLTRGQAFFAVTRDATRPFYVTAGNTMVRVVGTKFDVHYGQQAVRVAVVEGRVEVSSSSEGRGELGIADTSKEEGPGNPRWRGNPLLQNVEHVVLNAGEAAIATPTGQIATADASNTADMSAWRQGRLVYVDARLRDVVADINRYYNGKIEITDPTVGDMQLTTAFRTDQIDRVLDVLENALPVQAVRTESHRIVLERSPAH